MKIKSLLSIFFAAAFLLNACQKNTDIFIPDAGQLNGPDTAWTIAINSSIQINSLKSNLLIKPFVDSFEVNANVATVTGEAFGNPDCLRLSYATSEEQLTEAFRRIKLALTEK